MERRRNTGKDVGQLARVNASRIEQAYPNTRPGVIVVNHGNGTFTVDIPGEGIIAKVPAQYPLLLKYAQPDDPVVVGYLRRKRRIRFILGSYPGTVARGEPDEGSMKKMYRPEFGWFAQHFNGGRGRNQGFAFHDPDEAYGIRACAQVPEPWELDPEWPTTRWLPGQTLPLTWKFIPLQVDERETIDRLDEDGNPETVANPAYKPILDRMIIPNGGTDAYCIDLRNGLFTELWDGAAIATELAEIGRGMLYQESGIIDVRTGIQTVAKVPESGFRLDVHLSYSTVDPPTVAKPVMLDRHNQLVAKLYDMETMAPHVEIDLRERFGDVRGARYFTMDGGSIVVLFTRYNGGRYVSLPVNGISEWADDADLVMAAFWSVTGETLIEEVIAKSAYSLLGSPITPLGESVGLGNGSFAVVYSTEDSPRYVNVSSTSTPFYRLQTTRRQWLAIGGQSGITVRRELVSRTSTWSGSDERFNIYGSTQGAAASGFTSLGGFPILCRDFRFIAGQTQLLQPYMALIDPVTGAELWRDTSYVVTEANKGVAVKYIGGSGGRQSGAGGYHHPRGVVFRRREKIGPEINPDPNTTRFNDMATISLDGFVRNWTDITPWYGPQLTTIGAGGTPCVLHDEHIYISKTHQNSLYPAWAVPGVANNTVELFRLRQPGPPRITSVYIGSGPEAGGTVVTIRGKRFTGATSVKFGGVESASFVFVSSVKLTATSPPGTAGLVQVTVTADAGTSVDGATFQYVAPDA